jgi:hypothetical protein
VVPEEWPSRIVLRKRGGALQNPAYRPADVLQMRGSAQPAGPLAILCYVLLGLLNWYLHSYLQFIFSPILTVKPKKNRLTALTIHAIRVSMAPVLPSRPLGNGSFFRPLC